MAVGSVVGGDILFFWVIFMVTELVFVAELWWKVMSVFATERDKKVERKERWKRSDRTKFFILFVGIVYIILISCM